MTNLERFQNWYVGQCDGDWEHTFQIKISTLDNPGWAVSIDLQETVLENREFPPVRLERTEGDWLFASTSGGVFTIYCGARNLEEALGLFCDWAEDGTGRS